MEVISAIPTKYSDVEFRSRLEARWAAFFDSLRWRWEYEPVDLNGYIPDFILDFRKPLLVEVKPVLSFGEFENYTDKIESSGWDGEAIIVGAKVFESDSQFDSCVLGMLGELPPVGARRKNELWWDEGQLDACPGCRHGISHVTGSYHCRRCGAYDGNLHGVPMGEIMPAWREAGNKVQWKKPARQPSRIEAQMESFQAENYY